jgi:integrase
MSKQTGAQIEKKLEASIKDLPPGRHGFGNRLWLEVAGGRSWTFRFMMRGRARSMGLGSWPTVTLDAAREKVTEALKAIEAGTDPLDQRQREKMQAALTAAKSKTFDEVATAYIAEHEPSWRNPKHRQQWRNTLATYASPVLGKLPVADVGTEHVKAVLQPIWATKRETANRVRGRIETILAYAMAHNWRTGENPARWHNHIQMIFRQARPAVEHHAALDWQDLPPFMARLRQQDGYGAMALEFAILTAARSGEVRGATWNEIDLDKALWHVPTERMKAKKPHVVPLSAAAIAVLRRAAVLRGTSLYVFQGMAQNRPLSDMSLLAVFKRLGRADITTHGMRASFKTWCGETGKPDDLSEAALAHTRGKLHETYMRGQLLDRRRVLMEQWADYCGGASNDELRA